MKTITLKAGTVVSVLGVQTELTSEATVIAFDGDAAELERHMQSIANNAAAPRASAGDGIVRGSIVRGRIVPLPPPGRMG